MDLGLSRLLKGEMTIFIPQVIKQVNWCCIPRNKKDAACMHTELSAVLNSCFVNWYHYWVRRHMFRFFPWNSKSLIVSIPISCNRGYPLWENSIDLSWPITSVQNAYLKNIFFFYIIYDYYHYDIIISDSSSYKSVGIHWTIYSL